jgi:hypothetical protein
MDTNGREYRRIRDAEGIKACSRSISGATSPLRSAKTNHPDRGGSDGSHWQAALSRRRCPETSTGNPFHFRYLFPMTVKDQILRAIHRLPDDIDYRDVAEEVAFLAAVREAERDIDEGRLISNEQMKARLSEWVGK